MRVAISTGGGDAPGLNAVIRAVVLSARARGWETWGIQRGYAGLLGDAECIPLDRDEVRGITHVGGTILGASNRGNPFRYVPLGAPADARETDRSDELVAEFRRRGFDALVSIGGDGSLQIADRLRQKGVPVVCVPKTIDNDIPGTERTFGYVTAVQVATEAIDRLHTTAESHDRVMVVELMGRHAGWIALASGIAGSADAILIPEIPFDIEKVAEKVREREAHGRRFSIIVVAEGAVPKGGAVSLIEKAGAGTVDRLGGIAARVADAIGERTGKETRSLVLGHLQRGGSPSTSDRLLALRFGAAAVRAIADGTFGVMVAIRGDKLLRVPIAEVAGRTKTVPLDSDTIQTARDLGITLGD
jgi:6-phosphofructokinase 1